TWRAIMPVLKRMGVRHVNIAFDIDAMSNPYVGHYLKELVHELRNEGYSANIAMWNEEDGKGIDDCLIAKKFAKLQKLF
ncbi:MAG: DUF3854 domain-containing protein, partial [Paenisporosarcina sp.]|nr:DUF3854 domain-containing protein [Paenisporosarcina sp.]